MSENNEPKNRFTEMPLPQVTHNELVEGLKAKRIAAGLPPEDPFKHWTRKSEKSSFTFTR